MWRQGCEPGGTNGGQKGRFYGAEGGAGVSVEEDCGAVVFEAEGPLGGLWLGLWEIG